MMSIALYLALRHLYRCLTGQSDTPRYRTDKSSDMRELNAFCEEELARLHDRYGVEPRRMIP